MAFRGLVYGLLIELAALGIAVLALIAVGVIKL
jgi:hypothetical protein